jgi:hypothetical protein
MKFKKIVAAIVALTSVVSADTVTEQTSFAFTSSTPFYQTALSINGVEISTPKHTTAWDGYTTTSFIPLWYMEQLLNLMGINASWDGNTFNLQPASTYKVDMSNLPAHQSVTSSRMAIAINNTVVDYAPRITRPDPADGIMTTYVPIAYLEDTLHRLGIQSSWDGTHWSITSQSLSGVSGELISAGINPEKLNGLITLNWNDTWKFDGAKWNYLNSSGQYIYDMFPSNGKLYAASQYAVSVLNKNTWELIEPKSQKPQDVSSVVNFNGSLYVGTIGGVYRIDKSGWTPLSNFPSPQKIVGAMTVYQNHIVANSDSGVYEWTGTTWSKLGNLPMKVNYVGRLKVIGGKLVAAEGVLYQWNGKTWEEIGHLLDDKGLGSNNPNSVVDFAAYGKYIIADTQNSVWEWNGSTWNNLGAPPGAKYLGYYLVNANGILVVPADNGIWIWSGSKWIQIGDFKGATIAL